MSIAIFRRFVDDSKTEFIRLIHISFPKTGFLWENVPEGNYLISVYVDRPDCQFSCADNSKLNSTFGCKICPHTMLNFSIFENKYTEEWLRSTAITSFVKAIVIAIFGNFKYLIIF